MESKADANQETVSNATTKVLHFSFVSEATTRAPHAVLHMVYVVVLITERVLYIYLSFNTPIKSKTAPSLHA